MIFFQEWLCNFYFNQNKTSDWNAEPNSWSKDLGIRITAAKLLGEQRVDSLNKNGDNAEGVKPRNGSS